MNTSKQNPTINPDFKHRLIGEMENFASYDLANTVGAACERAEAILQLLSLQFESDINRTSDEVIASALYAAINEITDIAAIVDAFQKADIQSSQEGDA